jgi:glycosyltransferase involved in cell wall biosynthesis
LQELGGPSFAKYKLRGRSMKKIVWINTFASRKGGAERVIESIIKSLGNKNYEHILLYKFDSDIDFSFTNLFSKCFPIVSIKEQLKQIDPDSIQLHNFDDYNLMKELLNFKNKVFTFIHDHSFLCPRKHKYSPLSLNTCEKKMSLVSCTACCGLIVKENKKIGFKLPIELIKKLKVMSQYKGLFVASKYMKKSLMINGMPENKIFYHPLFTRIKKNKKDPYIKKQVTYMGQLEKGKGVDLLIKAYALSDKSFELIILGDGSLRSNLEGLVNSYKIKDKVTFMGKVDDKDIANIVGSSIATVCPSRSPETFNLSALESIILGTPVIASNIGAYLEWYIPGVTGEVFKSNNYYDLAKVLESISHDRSRWHLYRHRIESKFLEKNYSVDSYVVFFKESVFKNTNENEGIYDYNM